MMATTFTQTPLSTTTRQVLVTTQRSLYHTSRSHASASSLASSVYATPSETELARTESKSAFGQLPPLARLPTISIVRSLFLSTFFTSPLLFTPGFAVFQKIANSKSTLLNPDRNPLLRALIRPVVYDHFCAGRDAAEIDKTSSTCRQLGFSGVVLSYSKEVQVSADKGFLGYDESKSTAMDEEIRQWKQGNLETLDMMREGDWLGIKLSGAGLGITKALMNGEQPPPSFSVAMDEICERAASQGRRLWIDSEQSMLQASIDKWTIDMMRKYNRNGNALVYNTIQAYLKSSRDKVQEQLQLASNEGWKLAIKLVRGAYIGNDVRPNIHDTKSDTDVSYDSIVEDLLKAQRFPVFNTDPNIKFELLLAGHNTNTIRKAMELASDLAAQSKLINYPEFAQLQGMADEVGCELLQAADQAQEQALQTNNHNIFVPRVYKYLTWGSIQECMQYLTRRLIENRGAAERMKEGMHLLRKELWRRTFA